MYKGHTIRDLLVKKGKNFHKYLQWCATNVKNFKESLNEEELIMLKTGIPINIYSNHNHTKSRIPDKTFTLYDVADINKIKVTIEYIPKISFDSEKYYIVKIDAKSIDEAFKDNEHPNWTNRKIRWKILYSSFLYKYTRKSYYSKKKEQK